MKKYIPYLLLLLSACTSKKYVISNAGDTTENAAAVADNYNLYYSADKARLLGNYAKAKELFAQLLAKEPNNAAANYFYGTILQSEGYRKQSLERLKKAADLDPKNSVYKESYAIALIYNTQVTEGTKILIDLSDRNRGQSMDYLYKALYFLEQNNNLAKAIEVAELIEKKHGFDDEISNRKIRIFDKQNNTIAMLSELDKLIAYDPNEYKYYIAKSELCKELKQSATVDSIAQILETKFIDEPDAIRALLKKAKDKNDKPSYNKFLGKALDNKNIDALSKMEILWPSVREAEKDSTLQNEVLQNFKKVQQKADTNNLVNMAYANVLAEFNKPREALSVFKNVLQKDSSLIDAWQNTMSLHLSLTEYDSTIAVFNRAIKFHSTESSMYLYGGQAYLLKDNLEQAISTFEKGLQLANGKTNLLEMFYANLAEIYNTKKTYQKSDSFYDAALNLNPNNASNLNNYAYYLSVRNVRLDEAATMSIQSLNLVPNNKTFLDTYAWILFKQNKLQLAEKTMKEALEADGTNDGVLFEHYGDILFNLNRVEEAIENWKKAKAIDPKLPNIDKKITNKKLYE
jgi:tetratricopeptide (TPR) repeat protein